MRTKTMQMKTIKISKAVGTRGVLIAVLAIVAGSSPTSPRERSPFEGTSEWWPAVRQIDVLLRGEKWKIARRDAKSLAEKIVGHSWYGPDLDRVLGELALAQAIADANLRRDHEAIWYWHVACNLNFRLRIRDVSSYGRAARIFAEHKLREVGSMPAGFEDREITPLVRSTPPRPPEIDVVTILNNTAAARENPGDFHLEVIVDKEGRLHHPVVKSSYLHPVLIYAALKWIWKLPPFVPRSIEGKATDSRYPISVAFRYGRW